MTGAVGEWTYEVHELSTGYSAIVYDEHGQRIADHLSEERARLIAAAPETHEELAWFVDQLDRFGAVTVDSGETKTRLRAARAALAKTGAA